MVAKTANRIAFVLTALVALALLGAIALAPSAEASSSAERAFVDKLNEERRAEGLGTLEVNTALRSVARDWSSHMASCVDGASRRGDCLRHNPSFSNQVTSRVTSDWSRLGENVGYTILTGASEGQLVSRIHQALMDSSAHRANILGDYNQVGVGVRVASDGSMWVTQNFMKAPSNANPPVETIDEFNDVPASHTHARDIAKIANVGITRGCGSSSRYCPDQPVTRAQMASFLVRALDDISSGGSNGFRDVSSSHTHGRDISGLADAGITRGCGSSTRYCPDQPVTRAQMASFLVRALGL